MIKIKWSDEPLKPPFLQEVDKKGIVSPWLIALEDLDGSQTHLKFVAQGKWAPMNGLPACDPDGLVGQFFPEDKLVIADCPVGALIGRVGGGSSSLKAPSPATDSGESKPFAIGRLAIVKLPANSLGPVFLGFNVLMRPIALQEKLEVKIYGGTVLLQG